MDFFLFVIHDHCQKWCMCSLQANTGKRDCNRPAWRADCRRHPLRATTPCGTRGTETPNNEQWHNSIRHDHKNLHFWIVTSWDVLLILFKIAYHIHINCWIAYWKALDNAVSDAKIDDRCHVVAQLKLRNEMNLFQQMIEVLNTAVYLSCLILWSSDLITFILTFSQRVF